jgi:hypothetical protein
MCINTKYYIILLNLQLFMSFIYPRNCIYDMTRTCFLCMLEFKTADDYQRHKKIEHLRPKKIKKCYQSQIAQEVDPKEICYVEKNWYLL